MTYFNIIHRQYDVVITKHQGYYHEKCFHWGEGLRCHYYVRKMKSARWQIKVRHLNKPETSVEMQAASVTAFHICRDKDKRIKCKEEQKRWRHTKIRWGEFSQKTQLQYMAKWWCLLARKNYMFRPIAPIFRFWQFSAKRVLYNMPKPRGDFEILSSFCVVLLS